MIRPGIAQVLSAGRRLGTRSYSTAKPELSQFSKPLTSTFFLASGVYTTMHFIWWRLENDERKKAYKGEYKWDSAILATPLTQCKSTTSRMS